MDGEIATRKPRRVRRTRRSRAAARKARRPSKEVGSDAGNGDVTDWEKRSPSATLASAELEGQVAGPRRRSGREASREVAERWPIEATCIDACSSLACAT